MEVKAAALWPEAHSDNKVRIDLLASYLRRISSTD